MAKENKTTTKYFMCNDCDRAGECRLMVADCDFDADATPTRCPLNGGDVGWVEIYKEYFNDKRLED